MFFLPPLQTLPPWLCPCVLSVWIWSTLWQRIALVSYKFSEHGKQPVIVKFLNVRQTVFLELFERNARFAVGEPVRRNAVGRHAHTHGPELPQHRRKRLAKFRSWHSVSIF